jgi:hypothetical protein
METRKASRRFFQNKFYSGRGPCIENQPMSFGVKNMIRRREKGENVTEKGRKGKEKGRKGKEKQKMYNKREKGTINAK